MTAATHTPGPWFLEGNWKVGAPLGGWVSSFPPSGSPVFQLVPVVGKSATIIANANLIANAPDLLDALKRITKEAELEGMARYAGWDCWIIMANQAIAKAEGRTTTKINQAHEAGIAAAQQRADG